MSSKPCEAPAAAGGAFVRLGADGGLRWLRGALPVTRPRFRLSHVAVWTMPSFYQLEGEGCRG